jgi:hypothetical protein
VFGDGTYTGAFIDSKPHGKGTLTLYGGDQYDGAWRNAWMSGQGTFTWASSGDKYSGMFHQNLMQGKGTFISTTGWNFAGILERGRPTEGVLTETDVSRFNVTYSSDCDIMERGPTPATKVQQHVCFACVLIFRL